MKDWQNRLENTLESLELQSGLLASAVELYDNINKLQKDLTDSYLGFEESKSQFNEVSNILKKDLSDLRKEINNIKHTLANELGNINKSNIVFQKKILNDIDTLKNHIDSKIDEVNNLTQKNIQELYQDNKNFQKELDASLITRLNKHKSNIQIEIRNEGSQIQRAFETTLNSNFNSMESKLKDLFEVQSKQLNMLKILIFIVIGIGIALAFGLYLK